MASQQNFGVLVPRGVVDFCPSPLHVRRKSRKATFYKRIGRKPTHFRHHQSAYGPLDDIINEISCEIWRVPSNASSERGASGGEDLLYLTAIGTVLPLPISRIPSDLPLIVRKNRSSRSTASGTSVDINMGASGESSRKESISTNETSFASSSNNPNAPWPPIDSECTITQSVATADTTTSPKKGQDKRSSRRRIFSKGLSLLRRATADETEKPQLSSTISEHERDEEHADIIGKTLKHASANFISPFDARQLQIETMQQKQHNPELVSVLKAGIRIIPEDKILNNEDVQDMWVAVEVEGMCHNRQRLADESIDVAFIVDNRHQTWDPPRPNPAMTDVIVAIGKSLESAGSIQERTHLIILSPTTHNLHKVSDTFPLVHMHQVNVSILPMLEKSSLEEPSCPNDCCKNVTVNNWTHYQSIPLRLRQIIQYARSEQPIGEITNVRTDVRPQNGCEVVEYLGSKDIDFDTLRLGQTLSFMVHIRIHRQEIQELDMKSEDPFFQTSLNTSYWKEDLRNYEHRGASMAHLLTVQVVYQSSLQAEETWHYTEGPLIVMKEKGRLDAPLDTFMELQKRMLFYQFSRLGIDNAREEITRQAIKMEFDEREGKLDHYPQWRRDELRTLIQRMSSEIYRQGAVRGYEEESRQKIPIYPGPIRIMAPPHEWLVDMWNFRENMRRHQGY
ncbi:hypothetical protein DM02DRAFT_586576 [Periconia macrospinosa]|uniref:Uncharacterized protein n=1 Tax=Periconia macrospinosa TaxID=97972 RepID=A0A2V1E0Q6_9PLEO|nr:hypothetical protein DM02DRAFT_586576 [Periconia macrospinosa]